MSATMNFVDWYYYALNGWGGWLFFFFIALAAVIWVFFDSYNREIKATGWRLGVVLALALFIPTMLFKWVAPTDPTMLSNWEIIFYLGILGALITPALGVGYHLNTQDEGFENEREPRPPKIEEPVRVRPVRNQKPKTSAWIVASDRRTSYQLSAGSTTIGRSPQNDIQLVGDNTVSGRHAKIDERNGHFTYTDLASANGSRINGRRVTGAQVLQDGDEVQLGRGTSFRFKK